MTSVEDTLNNHANKNNENENDSKEHSYFEGHKCDIPSYMLSKHEFKCSKFRSILLVRQADPRAKHMFRSYESLSVERYRQYKHYPLSIHPFSSLRLAFEMLIAITIFIKSILVAAQFSATHLLQYPALDAIIHLLESLYFVNILVNFFTGFVKGTTMKHVVLDSKHIIWRYLRTWFVIDVLSSGFVIHDANNPDRTVRPHIVMMGLKVLRLPTMLTYISNVLTAFNIGIMKQMLLNFFVYVSMYLTWNIFFQFAMEYFEEESFNPSNPRVCSWITIGKLWNSSDAIRFTFSLDRAVGMLRANSNLHLLSQNGCFELFFVISGIVSKLLVLHCALKYMIVMFGAKSARAKYYMMTQQVQTYMNQRKFPLRIKKKILKFYAIRFMSHYFNEAKMISCVSGKLREDIIMHISRHLVSHVKFLQKMPRALLLQIEMKLKIVVFISGDIIIKINTVGDCLYFIDKGTVAVYSESGKEVCHLDDGDFFGEIALVTTQRFRTASVVAVTNCELFRLDTEDFESTIACYSTVYEDIKQVAKNRLDNTNILDAHHKSELQNLLA